MGERPLWERYALDIFGAIPRGNLFGCPIWEDPSLPDDRIKFVHPDGREDVLILPRP